MFTSFEFAGKYTFESTNATGTRKYLTSASNHGLAYPSVSATRVGSDETWIAYADSQGDLIVQMGDLSYLSAHEDDGLVVGTRQTTDAYRMKAVDEGGGEVSFQIFLTGAGVWKRVRYSVDDLLPFLVFDPALVRDPAKVAPASTALHDLARTTVTPSLAAIRKSRDARGLDLRHVDLTGADLRGVDCSGADFSGATLTDVDLSGADLSRARFTSATFDRTFLSGATLDGASFGQTDLSKAVWGQAIHAAGTDFSDCTAIGCTIGSQDPTEHCVFDKATFDGADFSFCDFTNGSFVGASLIHGVFIGAVFEQADFTAAELGGVDRTSAADLAFAYLPNVDFTQANLFGVSFAGASLFGASTRIDSTASLEEADFSNAYLEGITLTGGNLRGTNFAGACLVNVDLTQVDLGPTLSGSVPSSLVGACLQGASFSGAKLGSADLSGATVSFGNGQLPVRYCDPTTGGPFPPPPEFEQLRYRATVGLDRTTLQADTICPNGLTVAANQRQGHSLRQMLTTGQPATQWVPLGCRPSGASGRDVQYQPP